jgi:23S rRNA pseudouridine1911/1915/1917 synthase
VHRLDKDTSGVLVVAKTDQAHQHLARQFQEHSVKRQYQALVWGKPNAEQGTVDAPLGRHPTRRKDMAVVEDGRRAITHQIRAHLASLGLPVVGDPQYGRSPLRRLGKLSSHARAALAGFQRQALHAERLGFVHPETGKPLMFRTQPPEDFLELLAVLEAEVKSAP